MFNGIKLLKLSHLKFNAKNGKFVHIYNVQYTVFKARMRKRGKRNLVK